MHLIPKLLLAFASLLPLVAGAITVPGNGVETLSGIALVDVMNKQALLSDIRQSTDIATIETGGTMLGRARTLPGVNQVEAALPDSYAVLPGVAAFGISSWKDTLTFSGIEPGVAQLSFKVNGQLTGRSSGRYLLVVGPPDQFAPTPTTGDEVVALMLALVNPSFVPAAGNTVVTAWGNGEMSETFFDLMGNPVDVLTGKFAYTPGVPITIFSSLVGVVAPGGSFSFFSDFSWKIAPPPGAGYVAASGTQYPAAVPEPRTWVLMVAGIAFVGWAVRLR